MKISVIGCGRWGSFIAWYLDRIGQNVLLYGREKSLKMQAFIETRTNGLVTLGDSVGLTCDLSAVRDSEVIVISVDSQGLSALMAELSRLELKNKIFVLCMKGIEISTGRRLSQVASDALDTSNSVAVWLGPGHVQEFCRGIPNCMVIDSDSKATKEFLVNEFSSELIRFYYGQDLIGNEIGAASKNVIGIAAGMLDGLGISSLKGALMSRGTREISRLIKALGGNELSAYGLCHLGDYEATVFSEFSHNRRYGEMFIKGEKYDSLAEGCYTVEALMQLENKYDAELPICNTVHDILYNNSDPEKSLSLLFDRSIKNEFDL
ncbi:MAG: NAD(P)H-dependent glycerol-3-phosphate dehydrogenase [Oscillospiraceae bacterium]